MTEKSLKINFNEACEIKHALEKTLKEYEIFDKDDGLTSPKLKELLLEEKEKLTRLIEKVDKLEDELLKCF